MAGIAGNGTIVWAQDERGVVDLTLNRPDVGNAYNEDVIHGLHVALDVVEAQPAVRVVVLRGAGRHFQAGADLGWIAAVAASSDEENRRVSELTGGVMRRLDALPMPTVALVHGGCFGGGTGLVASCDVVVASADAVFAVSEARWGLLASIILPQLCRAIGTRQARRYALTGERFDADAARRIGLVHEVCPRDALDATGARLVEAILMSAPQATRLTKRRLRLQGDPAEAADFADLVHEHALGRQTAEGAEGIAAFQGKRSPAWVPPQGPSVSTQGSAGTPKRV